MKNYIKICHTAALEAGWWEGLTERDLPTKIALIHSELSEAVDGILYNRKDDKLPHRLMEEVEMADTYIRMCDYMGRLGHKRLAHFDIKVHHYDSKLAAIGRIHADVSRVLEFLRKDITQTNICNRVLDWVESYCKAYNLDLFGAIEEKLEFNRGRADHKPENRAKQGGKKF